VGEVLEGDILVVVEDGEFDGRGGDGWHGCGGEGEGEGEVVTGLGYPGSGEEWGSVGSVGRRRESQEGDLTRG